MKESKQSEKKSFWGTATGVLFLVIMGYFALCILILLSSWLFPCGFTDFFLTLLDKTFGWTFAIFLGLFIFVSGRRVDEVKDAFNDSHTRDKQSN